MQMSFFESYFEAPRVHTMVVQTMCPLCQGGRTVTKEVRTMGTQTDAMPWVREQNRALRTHRAIPFISTRVDSFLHQ